MTRNAKHAFNRNVSFEYGRLGDPLSGLAEVSTRDKELRLAQLEADRWSRAIVDSPSDKLKSFLTHAIFDELSYRNADLDDYDKNHFSSQFRVTPVDAIFSILSDEDVDLLADTGFQELTVGFESALDNIAFKLRRANSYSEVFNTEGQSERTHTYFEQAVNIRKVKGRFQLPISDHSKAPIPGSDAMIALTGNAPSRLPVIRSESFSDDYFVVIEIRKSTVDTSRLAYSPLSLKESAGLIRYLQDVSLLGSSREINEAYLRNYENVIGQITNEDDERVVFDQLFSDMKNLSKESLSALETDFFDMVDYSDLNEHVVKSFATVFVHAEKELSKMAGVGNEKTLRRLLKLKSYDGTDSFSDESETLKSITDSSPVHLVYRHELQGLLVDSVDSVDVDIAPGILAGSEGSISGKDLISIEAVVSDGGEVYLTLVGAPLGHKFYQSGDYHRAQTIFLDVVSGLSSTDAVSLTEVITRFNGEIQKAFPDNIAGVWELVAEPGGWGGLSQEACR